MSVKSEIEQHRYLLNLARNLYAGEGGSTLADLRDELNRCSAIVAALIERYGESVAVNDATFDQPFRLIVRAKCRSH